MKILLTGGRNESKARVLFLFETGSTQGCKQAWRLAAGNIDSIFPECFQFPSVKLLNYKLFA